MHSSIARGLYEYTIVITPHGIRETADMLLQAFASSDLASIADLCSDDLLLWGTDEAEDWTSKAAVLEAFDGAFDLRVTWVTEPIVHDDWLAGVVRFEEEGNETVIARVTMVFQEGLLVHGHYSRPQ